MTLIEIAVGTLILGAAECQPTENDSTAIRIEYNNDLRLELFDMFQRDQAVRMEFMNVPPRDSTLFMKGVAIDRENTARMREIIATYGWPGKSMVGFDGVQAACMLILHADMNRDFQKECLSLMEKAAVAGEVPIVFVAYLTDRLLALDGQKQKYGTQGKMEGGEFVPFPLEDEEHVDSLRASVGLPPLDQYKQMMRTMHSRQDTSKQ